MTKIVNSLLALAVSSSVVLAQGWSGAPGKGLSYDSGDGFSLKMANQLQTHWVYMNNENAVDGNNFTVRRARTTFSGSAFNVDYVLTLDATDGGGDSPLKDGHATWNFTDMFGLRVGQGKTQFGLEGTGSSKGLFFAERATAARTFSDARSRGAWLTGSYRDNSIRWSAGAMNGSATGVNSAGEAASNDDDELSYVISANWDPMGDVTGGKNNEAMMQGDFREGDRSLAGTIGVGYAMENTTGDVENTTLNVNTRWCINGFSVIAELFDWESDVAGDPSADGFAVSGTYVMPKSADSPIQWGFGARLSQTDLTDLGGDEQTDISVVANAFYHGHAAKTQFEITQREMDAADTTDYIFTIAFQLLF